MVKKIFSLMTTLVLVTASVYLAVLAYKKYEVSPWTRHGIVKADIIKIAPEVHGKIEQVYVANNQEIKKGDLLFRIDSRPYTLKDEALVGLKKARQDIESLKAGVTIAVSRLKSAQAVLKDAEKNKKRNTFLYAKAP